MRVVVAVGKHGDNTLSVMSGEPIKHLDITEDIIIVVLRRHAVMLEIA